MQDIKIHFQDYSFVKVDCSPSIGMELRDYFSFEVEGAREGANKRGNSSRLTQSFHFFMFEPI
ncbi:hypothetical protein POX54_14245, partial [Escherichia coli]